MLHSRMLVYEQIIRPTRVGIPTSVGADPCVRPGFHVRPGRYDAPSVLFAYEQ
jgi:hypothetical protein